MSNITLIDILPLDRELKGIFDDIIGLKYKAQDILYANKGLKYPFQRGKKDFSRGLLTISSFLKSRGHNVKYTTNKNDFLSLINDGDFVAVPTITPYMNLVQNIVKTVKKQKDVKVVLGGYHSNFLPKETFSFIPEADFIVHGEGELSTANLIEGNLTFPGISLNNNGSYKISNKTSLLSAEEIPNPDYSLLPLSLENYRFNIQTARGCLYRCDFCVNGFFWGNPRYTSIDKVEQELVFLSSVLPEETFIHFSDNIFTASKKHALDVCDIIINNNINFQFSGDIRAKFIDEELVKKMEDANFKRLCLGFEDANDSIVSKSKGYLNLEDNIKSAKVIRNNSNIVIEAYWIIGLPGTNFEFMLNNLNIAEQLVNENIVDALATSTIFTPLPGSPIYNTPEKFDVNIKNKNWDAYIRHNYEPIYSLSNLNQNQLKSYLLLFESTLLKTYCNKIGIEEKDVLKVHKNMFAK